MMSGCRSTPTSKLSPAPCAASNTGSASPQSTSEDLLLWTLLVCLCLSWESSAPCQAARKVPHPARASRQRTNLVVHWRQPSSSCATALTNGSIPCSVEDCPQLKSLPFSTFNQIVETCTAGDVAMARAMLESLKLDSGPKEAAGSKPSQRAYFEAAAPAKVCRPFWTTHTLAHCGHACDAF